MYITIYTFDRFLTLTDLVLDLMDSDKLTWNEFQRRFKGRWSQKELSQRFSEHKTTGAMPLGDDQIASGEKTARTGRPKHAKQMSAVPSSAVIGKSSDTENTTSSKLDSRGNILTWNQFQVRWEH